MIKIEPTANLTGVYVQGDYDDFYELVESIYNMVGFTEDYDDPYYGVKMRILGVCYDLRHAYQRDRNILLVDNGMDKESMKWHGIITPLKNVYFGVEFMFPEVIFAATLIPVLFASGKRNYDKRSMGTEETYTPPHSQFLRDKANLEVFSAAIWQALEQVIGQEEMHKLIKPITESNEYYHYYVSQYIDKLNIEYLNTPVEERKKKLRIITKRILKKPEAYYKYENFFRLSAKELKVSIYELDDPQTDYPEDILW